MEPSAGLTLWELGIISMSGDEREVLLGACRSLKCHSDIDGALSWPHTLGIGYNKYVW